MHDIEMLYDLYEELTEFVDLETGFGFKGEDKFHGNGTVGFAPGGRKATKKKKTKRKKR